METATCTVCKRVLPVTEFHRRARSATGYRSECRTCQREQQRAYHARKVAENPLHWREVYQRQRPNGPGHGWHGARIADAIATEATQRETEVIVGSLLGDASLTYSQRSVTAVLRERKTTKAIPYLEWKAAELGRFGARLTPHTARIHGREYGGAFLKTRGSPVFNDWYPVFYGDDRQRRIGYRAIANLTPLSLAIWLKDDGTLIKPYGKSIHPSYAICSERFPRADQQDIVDQMAELLRERPTLVPIHGAKWRIYLGVAATRRMAELCAPYWQPCMAYKFPYQELLP